MLINIIGIIFYNTLLVFDLCIIENKKLYLKSKNFYFAIFFVNILSIFNNYINIIELKPFINIIILIVANWLILKDKLLKSIIKVVIMYMLFLIVELIYLLLIIVINDAYTIDKLNIILNKINEVPYYSFAYNMVSSTLFAFMFNSKSLKKIYIQITTLAQKLNPKKALLNLCVIFLFFYFTYGIFSFSDKIYLNVIMIIILILIIIIMYFKGISVGNQYAEEKEKYNSTQQLLLEYEDMIDRYRVNNHENKNQLLIIQNMIKNNDIKVNEYIDDLVGNVYMSNEKTMMTVSIIPARGLRATIHTKLNIMEEKKIKYVLNVDRKLRIVDFDNISSDLNLKICKIISIFIDNAIDEVESHKKDKIVNIELYIIDNIMTLEISNKFENHFDIARLSEKKYTTKETGHGYGLALAKELVDSENSLTNYTRIDDDIFTQILEIKIKK